MKNELVRKGLVLGIIVLFFGAGVLPSMGVTVVDNKSNRLIRDSNTLYVGGTGEGNYSKIQDAIDNASDGDTVFVYSGFYDINDFIIINKSIRLIGENKINTIINGSSIALDVPKVNISGFTMQNSFGILIADFDNISIYGNIFKSNESFIGFGGIFIINSSYNTISDNSFFNCGLDILFTSYHNSVKNNTINGKPLVYFEDVSDKVIDDAGQIILIDCKNITVENLELNNSFSSIQLIDSFNCLISNNKFSNNNIVGFFTNSNDNIITENLFSNNIVCLLFVNCEGNNILRNSFQYNEGLLLFETSSCNLVSYNNFKYKYIPWNLKILSFESDNKWVGNYWNRPRLIPAIIWNFKSPKLINFPLMPTFPDIDWRPAKKPNDINGAKSEWSEFKVKNPRNRMSVNSLFQLLFDRYPLLEVFLREMNLLR